MARADFFVVGALSALIAGAASLPGVAYGQYVPDQNVPDVEGMCVSNCDISSPSTSSSDGWGAQLGTQQYQWLRRQLSGEAARDARRSRAINFNNEAIAASDLDQALRLYRQAHELWDENGVIRLNMMDVLIRLSARDFHARDPNDAAALDRVERLLNEAEALNRADMTSLSDYDVVTGWLRSGRNAVAQARADLARAAQNAAALDQASNRISAIAGGLAADLGGGARPDTTGLGFGDPSQVADFRDAPNSPPPVPPSFRAGVPRLEEVENSPGYEAWLRGMDAAARGDWTLAAAWFGTAQLRDPSNAALGRAVELAEWTRDFRRRTAALPPAVQQVVTGYDPALRTPEGADLEFLFPGQQPLSYDPTPEEHARFDAARRLNTTLPEDEDLRFDTVETRNVMVSGLPDEARARLASRGQAIRAGDWTDHLAPEVRGMVAELREAMPPRTFVRPDAAVNERLDAGERELGDEMASYAIVRVLYGDLEGAERALDDASVHRQGLGPATELVRAWRGAPLENDVVTGLAPGEPIQSGRR